MNPSVVGQTGEKQTCMNVRLTLRPVNPCCEHLILIECPVLLRYSPPALPCMGCAGGLVPYIPLALLLHQFYDSISGVGERGGYHQPCAPLTGGLGKQTAW